ncbi:hypothetical protein D8911_03560 [Levilactobacillus brevis]|nr:hypothetical protein D8911_03560 [Levilactobacillus brevis]
MPPVMFSVVTKYHKGRHSLFLYNSEIFYAFTQDILRSQTFAGIPYASVAPTARLQPDVLFKVSGSEVATLVKL